MAVPYVPSQNFLDRNDGFWPSNGQTDLIKFQACVKTMGRAVLQTWALSSPLLTLLCRAVLQTWALSSPLLTLLCRQLSRGCGCVSGIRQEQQNWVEVRNQEPVVKRTESSLVRKIGARCGCISGIRQEQQIWAEVRSKEPVVKRTESRLVSKIGARCGCVSGIRQEQHRHYDIVIIAMTCIE